MKHFNHAQSDAHILSTQPNSFNILLKKYLIPLGWSVIEDTSITLYLQNINGFILKSDNIEGLITLQGFRHNADIYYNTKSFPTKIQSNDFIVCSVGADLKWNLFANDFLFYFILNSELYGFGSYHPIYFENFQNCFLVGKTNTFSIQKLFTNLKIFESSNFSVTSSNEVEIPWSTLVSFSYDERIDLIKNTVVNHVPLSPIGIHETRTNTMKGILPDIYVLSSTTTLPITDSLITHTFANKIFTFLTVGTKILAFEIT